MFTEIITKKASHNLDLLSKLPDLKSFYLAGGTGLAFQFGHRQSLDFDFFTSKPFRSELMAGALSKIGKKGSFSLQAKSQGTLHGIFNQTKVTFLYYPYPPLYPLKKLDKIHLADYRDIACMKLDAVATRGSKKDFIDLYFICQKIELDKLLKIFVKKYQNINFNLIHLFKSLSYFTEADSQPSPKMLKDVSWTEVKKYFQNKVKLINKSIF